MLNKAAEKIIGITSDQARGKLCSSIFHSSICDGQCALKQSIESGTPVVNKAIYIIRPDGETVPISITASPLRNEEGKVIGGVETFRDLTEINLLREQLQSKYKIGDFISKSSNMQRMFSIIPDISQSISTVLISGESGTGKEVLARTIHELSQRKDKPFIAVNCGALPDFLVESELFGYKKGAFTDAKKDKPGKFTIADGGTLFLDEIGELSLPVQVKVLRAVQEKTYDPLGSEKSEKSDIRLIAATNKDLKEEVKNGNFREDLYYRLNVVNLQLPPLRKRKEDIPLLINHFIKKFNAINKKQIIDFSDQAIYHLMNHDYPGNIRELENIIEYAFIVCKENYIQIEHLPVDFIGEISKTSSNDITINSAPMTIDDGLKAIITNALKRNKFKRMATCRELNISKDRLRRLIQKFEIQDE